MIALPDSPVVFVAGLFVAFAAGMALVWRYARVAGRASRDAEIAQLRAEREALRESAQRAQAGHAAASADLDEQRKRVFALGNERAMLAGRLERLAKLDAELAAARAGIDEWREKCRYAEQRLAETATRLHEQHQAGVERERLLAHVREEFGDRFKALAQDLLDEKSRKFAEQNQTQIGQLLDPLREQLGDFRKRVDDVYDKENAERGLLKAEIQTLKNLNQRIGEEATQLARALKGESRAQGAWGELVLERLLEASGLRKGREYETQTTLLTGDGDRSRPDVIVHLPEGRDIIVDAKASLTAYERYCAAVDGHERERQMAAHLASMRHHVKELAQRRYSDLPGVRSLDFVLMFVPVEAAYIEAVHHDDGLHAFALEKQIVIVTASTLLATLRTVGSLWRNDDRNRNALDIAERAGRLYDKFAGFIGDLAEARGKLDAARDALASASNKLDAGRGNLVGQVEKLRELGAKASKTLPAEILDRARLGEDGEAEA